MQFFKALKIIWVCAIAFAVALCVVRHFSVDTNAKECLMLITNSLFIFSILFCIRAFFDKQSQHQGLGLFISVAMYVLYLI